MFPKTAFFLFLPAVLLILMLPGGYYLAITGEGGNTLAFQRVAPGDVVQYTYIHSVEKIPVTDTLVIDDGRLLLKNTTFSSSGAGLPTDDTYNLTVTDDGDYRVEGIDKPFDEVIFRIYRPNDSRIIVAGTEYPLNSLVEDGAAITVSVERPMVVEILSHAFYRSY